MLSTPLMETSNAETAPAYTVNDILDKYQRECVPKLAPRTQYYYRLHIEVLRAAFGTRIAEELRPKDFAGFLDVGREHGLVLRTKQLAVLSSAFTQAVRFWYWLPRNVLRSVIREKGEPRDRLIHDDEFTALRAMAPLRVQIAMDLALITGQRQGDILNFRWSDIEVLPAPIVDPVTKETITHELTVQQSKTKKRIGIAITKELDAVLDRCWMLPNRGEYIITRKIGGRYTSEGFRSLWQRVMRKWKRAGGEPLHYHDIRAMAATKQPTVQQAQALLGHSSPSLTLKIYRRGRERVIPTSVQIGR